MKNRKKRKLESDASESTESWLSSAGPFIVDGIVAALKHHPAPKFCWNRTAPSLRLLNKYWCHQMNRHVAVIGETDQCDWDTEPNLLDEDVIGSLLKFPNLTALDISRLSGYDIFPLAMNTLKQIPRLHRLIVNTKVMTSMDEFDFDGLVCHTVGIRDLDDPASIVEQLLKLSVIQMERFIIDHWEIEGGWIADFLAAAPSVKQLVAGYVTSEDDFEAMSRLEELELRYVGQSLCFESLAALTSIVSLDVSHGAITVDSFKLFVPLKRLRVLAVWIFESFAFDQSFYDVADRLTELEMTSDGDDYRELSQEFWEMAAGLEKLDISGFAVDADHLEQVDFGKMKTLHFDDCEVSGYAIPWDRLTSLTALDLSCIFGNDFASILALVDLTPLQNLRNLCLQFKDNDLTPQLLQSIKQLTNLEYLHLWNVDNQDLHRLRPFLEPLKDLPHLMFFQIPDSDVSSDDASISGISASDVSMTGLSD